jgi:hypothetical protein
MYYWNIEFLEQAKEQVAKKDPSVIRAYDKLIQDAQEALTAGPFSVTDKTRVPPSGDKHDFSTMAGYAWPNETDPKAPWRSKDGIVNPLREGEEWDHTRWLKLTESVETLTFAYFLSGDETYAQRASLLLRVWFLDPKTKMNPNVTYSGIKPNSGDKPSSVISIWRLVRVLDCTRILSKSSSWPKGDQDALDAWVATFQEWLEGDGSKEARYQNNRGIWHDAQSAYCALYVGKKDVAKKIVERSKIRHETIEKDGSLPEELRRTKSFGYSSLALNGWMCLASIGERVGIDLWRYQNSKGGSIQKAVDFLAPYTDLNTKWTYESLVEVKPQVLYPYLAQAYFVYSDPRYLDFMQKINDQSVDDRNRLIYAR